MFKKLFNRIFKPKTKPVADGIDYSKQPERLFCVNYVVDGNLEKEMKFFCFSTSTTEAVGVFWSQHNGMYYDIISVEDNVRTNTCTTCRFSNKEKDICTVGTYYAEKRLNKICYAGELWEIKTN